VSTARATLVALGLAVTLAAAAHASTPVLAVEDTVRLASGSLPEYVVRAPRVTLDEILRRVSEGEARRDSLMQDQVFTRIVKVVYRYDADRAGKQPKRKLEQAHRVFKKRPDHFREILLRRQSDEKDSDDVEISSNPGMGEQVASFAFEPRSRSRFRFTIRERHWVGGHVVYVVAFEPRSKADPLPSGQVWIDTNDYVIVREEFWYRDRSPAPLFIERIDRCVVERSRVDGKWWVITRLFGRVRLAGPITALANLGKTRVSQTVDFSALYTDWQVNRGIADSVFVAGK